MNVHTTNASVTQCNVDLQIASEPLTCTKRVFVVVRFRESVAMLNCSECIAMREGTREDQLVQNGLLIRQASGVHLLTTLHVASDRVAFDNG